ncbi:hypothetical protein C8046_04360 [Serinibacter arcticus]|uniref:Lipoprotein signal peptidase n=1 Tax=Serinibacter arcticus TaxID=1655435 RepID=A0A2U1ZST5_9MICO|nr:signal peptidase II [Serinibacter arcticus]PWD50021.1 hypothetical protein C8046_04360 [Serinibacter arcticus]
MTETTPAPSTAPTGAARAPRAPRRTVALLAGVAIGTLLLDQATKAIALERLVEGQRVPFLGDVLGWRLVFNPGAALSLGTGVTWIFTLAMVACAIAVVVLAPRILSRAWAVGAGALLGGALGNLVDRLARDPGFAVGHVVDFIDYGVFIGNVADIGIVAAAVGFVLLTLLGISWDGTREKRGRDEGAEAEKEAGDETASEVGGEADVDADAVAPIVRPADLEETQPVPAPAPAPAPAPETEERR